jgi:serpin B
MDEEPFTATTPRPSPPTPEDAAAAGVAATDDAFGADLYRLLTDHATDTVFSPVSVASALRIALCGARGLTAAELASALHGSPDTAAEGLRAVSAVVHEVAADGSVTFRAPSTIWVQSGLPLQPGFTAELLAAAAASFAAADFAGAPEAVRSEINRVIAEQTAGKITGLLPPHSVDVDTRLVLCSAMYLKAAWAEPFPENATHDAPFYPDGPGGPTLDVPMMRGTATRAYRRGDGYQAVMLPYLNGGLAMAVVLPDGPLTALGPAIAAGGLRGLLAGASRHPVALSMPRFRLEAAFDLIPVLRLLGVAEAFSCQADFSGITEAEALRISTVAHKAYVDVDEHGTEAAAATGMAFQAMVLVRTPPPVTMIVDRPFLFAIVHTPTGLPLFVGQVSHPRPR